MIGDIIKLGVDFAIGSYENKIKENAIQSQINYLKEANKFNNTLLNNKEKQMKQMLQQQEQYLIKKDFKLLLNKLLKDTKEIKNLVLLI